MNKENFYLAIIYAKNTIGKKGEFKAVFRSYDKIILKKRLEEFEGKDHFVTFVEISEDDSLAGCEEVIVQSGNIEETGNDESFDYFSIFDAKDDGERDLYENGHYETIFMTGSEKAEHLLGFNRHVIKVTDCK